MTSFLEMKIYQPKVMAHLKITYLFKFKITDFICHLHKSPHTDVFALTKNIYICTNAKTKYTWGKKATDFSIYKI